MVSRRFLILAYLNYKFYKHLYVKKNIFRGLMDLDEVETISNEKVKEMIKKRFD